MGKQTNIFRERVMFMHGVYFAYDIHFKIQAPVVNSVSACFRYFSSTFPMCLILLFCSCFIFLPTHVYLVYIRIKNKT